MSEKDQMFARFSYSDNPVYIPAPFAGIADGGAFQNGYKNSRVHQRRSQ